jgi:hypothetical protein
MSLEGTFCSDSGQGVLSAGNSFSKREMVMITHTLTLNSTHRLAIIIAGAPRGTAIVLASGLGGSKRKGRDDGWIDQG